MVPRQIPVPRKPLRDSDTKMLCGVIRHAKMTLIGAAPMDNDPACDFVAQLPSAVFPLFKVQYTRRSADHSRGQLCHKENTLLTPPNPTVLSELVQIYNDHGISLLHLRRHGQSDL
jgi:hypothetical protein